MDFLTRLERKFRWITIENLPLYVVTAQGLFYVWIMMNPQQLSLLTLNPVAVWQGGEYWRIFTFLFLVPSRNPLFAFLYLIVFYFFGSRLENEWGSFKFTIFYLVGVLGTVISALFLGSGQGTFYLNQTVFFAFAALDPDHEIMLFPIPINIKMKWLALIGWIFIGFQFLFNPWFIKAAILVSLVNYFLFFGSTHYGQIKAYIRRQKFKRQLRD